MGRICNFTILLSLLIPISSLPTPSLSLLPRKLALVPTQPIVLKYHNGPLLNGNITVDLIWYGKFSKIQRSIILDFLSSLNSRNTPKPSVSSWWEIINRYKGGPRKIVVGDQLLIGKNSKWKLLQTPEIIRLAKKADRNKENVVNVVLTSADVTVGGFCMSDCGTHGIAGPKNSTKFVYLWVGNPAVQCPGQCAWPFHKPTYGPQTPPLVAPNGDVGVDGMIINLATVLAGAVTNPFDNGYYQGHKDASLEAVSACTGIFGTGAFPGYPGKVLVDKRTKTSYNAIGVNGRKYLLPAIWDPQTSTCKPLV